MDNRNLEFEERSPVSINAGLTNNSQKPKGILLVIGGHEDKGEEFEENVHNADRNHAMEILEHFIKLTGKRKPVIEVITSASAEGAESFKDYERAFTFLGIKQIGHIHHDNRSDVMHTDLKNRLVNADGIFYSGGDQLKLTSIYGGTSFLAHLKDRYFHTKLVLAGTSAGAMAFSTPMIYAGNKELQQITGEVKITMGLEFLKAVCIDTHFVDRARFVRMGQVIASNPTSIGIGLEEDTAMIIRGGDRGEVIGTGVVIIMEGFGITETNILNYGSGERISVRDLKVHVLSKGSFYQIPG